MRNKKRSRKNLPKLQKKADATPLSIKNSIERDIRNNTDYDNRAAEINE